MTKSLATTLALCSAGIAFISYLYYKMLLAGYTITIPFTDVTFSL